MNKRLLILMAGTLVLAACGDYAGVCQAAGYSASENHNRDQTDQVECTAREPERPTEPAPRIAP